MPGPKTLVLAPEFAPLSGISPRAQAITDLCRALAQEGWDVTVILGVGSELQEDSHGLARRLEVLRHKNREFTVFEGKREGGAINVIALGSSEPIEPGTLLEIARDTFGVAPAVVQSFADQRGLSEAIAEFPLPRPASIVHLENTEALDLLALKHADRIVLPSKTLADAMRRSEEGPAAELSDRFAGVAPGTDVRTWNPARDRLLKEPLDPPTAANKAEAKASLRSELGLSDKDLPMIAVLGPLKLSRVAAEELSRLPIHLVAIDAGNDFAAMSSRDSGHTAIGSGTAAAHRSAAAADFFLPSTTGASSGLFPCRYGAAPIAQRSGEAADRLVDYDPASGTGTALLYGDPKQLLQAVRRAMRIWSLGEEQRQKLIDRCLTLDLSWGSAALQMTELVQPLL